MGYLDKINYKRSGSGFDETTPNTEKLNRTTYDKQFRENSPKNARGSSTARASNLVSNYGSEEKGGVSLKDMYFRDTKTGTGERNKVFRVKKDSQAKMNVEFKDV